MLATLQGWRGDARREVCEWLFAYALRERESGWPLPVLHGIRLAGADLSRARLECALFIDCRLAGTIFRHCTVAEPALIGGRQRHASPLLTPFLPMRRA